MPNHPAKGSIITVGPIRKLRDISTIKKMLQNKPRDYALFVIGINTSLRASELSSIKVKDVASLRPLDELSLREQKTGKIRHVNFNKACVDATRRLLDSGRYRSQDDYLFMSQRGSGHLTVSSIHRLVKSWCRSINLRGNYGSHTLRKTWGYHQHSTFGVSLSRLVECFGHSSAKITLSYLGITPEDIKNVYANEI